MDTAARRARITDEITAKTGITEEVIDTLVRRFYQNVRGNVVLGPIFEARITDWEPHLSRMTAFWSSVALMTGRYHGRPMDAHLPLPIDARHFDIWLAIFEKTAHEVCQPLAAAHFIERARRIAESLEIGVAMRHGVLPGRNERFHLPDSNSGTHKELTHAE
jgi:hemoglobin